MYKDWNREARDVTTKRLSYVHQYDLVEVLRVIRQASFKTIDLEIKNQEALNKAS